MSNNLATLTRGHTIVAAKKRARREQVKEVVFDEDARREFLTGFHKRKVAKTEAARKRAQERDKQARLQLRREQRLALRERAAENAKQIEGAYVAMYGSSAAKDNEWSGIENSSSPRDKRKQRDEEYEDEQVLATVTVVEEFDPDTLLHGPSPSKPISSSSTPTPPSKSPGAKSSGDRDRVQKRKPNPDPVKKPTRPDKIRYQTKEARKADRVKQLARRTEKAERAGGKAARRRRAGKGKERVKNGSKR